MKTSQKQGLDVWTALPLTVFLIGLCISGACALWLSRDNDAHARKEFDGHVQHLVNDVSRRFRDPIYGLNGARGMYAANRQMQRAEFRAYVESHDLPREFPGVRGFGFVQHVARDALAAFIATERADGAAEFGIRSIGAATRDDLYIIKFIEPAVGNRNVLGLDLGSEALRREGIERAIRTGEATLTAPIPLVQDERRSPGFLLFVPVFRNGIAATTPALAARAARWPALRPDRRCRTAARCGRGHRRHGQLRPVRCRRRHVVGRVHLRFRCGCERRPFHDHPRTEPARPGVHAARTQHGKI